jgi:hypothetical protein
VDSERRATKRALGADDTAEEEEEEEEEAQTTTAARERRKAAATGGGERRDAAIGQRRLAGEWLQAAVASPPRQGLALALE